MGLWSFQSVLNRGEIDPIAIGRIDLQQYYNGVAEALNVLAIPQGGLKKRPGQRYLGTGIFSADGSNGRLENFSFNVDLNYLLVFTDLRMQVYKEGVLQTNLNGSGNDYIITPWNVDQVKSFDYIQSADTIIITHPDISPRSITRTSDTSWLLSIISFDNIPQYDFNDALSPADTAQEQTITFTNVNEGDRFKLSLNGILTDEIVYSLVAGSGSIATGKAIIKALRELPTTPNKDIAFAVTSPTVFIIQFANSAADDWDLLTATPILTQNVAFTMTAAITQAGVSRKEDTWSSTRGWPITCTFHEGRLWFGGSKSRPQTLWGSFVNDFFNFFTDKARDDEAVEATLDTDQLNSIQAIFSNRSLQVFTSGGEFYIPTSPITPSNIAVSPQSNHGSKRVRPVTIDGVTLFLQRTGKSLMQAVFLDEFQANQSTSVSVLSPHLIKEPVQLYASRGTDISDANYVYIVNGDGTMTVFNTLIAQDVAGFTRWESGDIKSVAVVDNLVYLLIKRTINGSDVLYIEVEDRLLNVDSALYVDNRLNITTISNSNPALLTTSVNHGWTGGEYIKIRDVNGLIDINGDSVVNGEVYQIAVTGLNTAQFIGLDTSTATPYDSGGTVAEEQATVTGLNHLEGETVTVKGDGYVQPNKVVTGGQIVIDDASIIEVGLPYYPTVKTLPLNVNLQGGPNASQKKKIMRVSVQLYESNGVIVGGQRIADRTIGINQFSAPEPQTGLRRIFLSGWSLEADVTITQDTPMFMTILNIGLEVKV